jgi:hypothetical protein
MGTDRPWVAPLGEHDHTVGTGELGPGQRPGSAAEREPAQRAGDLGRTNRLAGGPAFGVRWEPQEPRDRWIEPLPVSAAGWPNGGQ